MKSRVMQDIGAMKQQSESDKDSSSAGRLTPTTSRGSGGGCALPVDPDAMLTRAASAPIRTDSASRVACPGSPPSDGAKQMEMMQISRLNHH